MNLNRAQIIGRITHTPELKTTKSGTSVYSFNIATNDNYKDKDGNKVENTDFHNITAFGKTAENIVKYFVKGQEIYIEGKLKTNNWVDEKCGKKHYKCEIIVEKFEFGQKPKDNTQGNTADKEQYAEDTKEHAGNDDVNVDEIPF